MIIESKPGFGKEGQIRQEHLRESHSQMDVRATQTYGQSWSVTRKWIWIVNRKLKTQFLFVNDWCVDACGLACSCHVWWVILHEACWIHKLKNQPRTWKNSRPSCNCLTSTKLMNGLSCSTASPHVEFWCASPDACQLTSTQQTNAGNTRR